MTFSSGINVQVKIALMCRREKHNITIYKREKHKFARVKNSYACKMRPVWVSSICGKIRHIFCPLSGHFPDFHFRPTFNGAKTKQKQ